jgi:hypothetical protein
MCSSYINHSSTDPNIIKGNGWKKRKMIVL